MNTVLPPDINKLTAQTITDKNRLQKSGEASKMDAARQPAAPELTPQVSDLVLSEKFSTAMRSAEFDENKVKQISDAIRQGNYPLDARRIAESFVPLEKML
jgi:negative regulator of flagellin synthesis FlgM